jgi:transcriptional regulator with XRE-family HTH domain
MIRKKKISPVERKAFIDEFALTTVALEVADAIRASGKSQREVAAELGVSEARISQILAISANPTVKTLARIADAVGRELQVKLVKGSHMPVEWEVISNGYYDSTGGGPSNVAFVEREEQSAA